MSRSRSSFELDGAIASAAALFTREDSALGAYRGKSLVSFDVPSAESMVGTPSGLPPVAPLEGGPALEDPHGAPESIRRPPKLPDFRGVPSPVVRCRKIIEWISEAIDASEVFIADESGLPIAGGSPNAEARMVASGVIASTVAQLAASIPGSTSSLFEIHVGEGPFFQLIGFAIGSSRYVVGFTRATPLSYRQAHAVRLACWHALGEPEQPPRDSSRRGPGGMT